MSENEERAKGKLQEIGGSIKETVGGALGNEQMQAEGTASRLEGEGRQEAAKTVGAAKGAAQELGGNIKQGAGDLLGNEQMQVEGKVDELKGEARQRANQ
jgi:uncharacterized protein YjbJ (UPF0337 family)